jgi:hypothetical protein
MIKAQLLPHLKCAFSVLSMNEHSMPTKTTIMMNIATPIIITTAATITTVTPVITTITMPFIND